MANEELRMQNIELALKASAELFIEYGPENTTKVMIAEKSGLSRRSIERYFKSGMECLLQTSAWLARHAHKDMTVYKEDIFLGGKCTAEEILNIYLNEVKELFIKEPRIFMCYVEIKTFIYRNSQNCQQDYERFSDALGILTLIRRIFKMGAKDGTINTSADYRTEAEYFYQMMIYYFSGLTLQYDMNPEKTLENIDEFIANMRKAYCRR